MIDLLLTWCPVLMPSLGTLALIGLALMALWRGHTERSREEVAILRRTIARLGWKESAFAAAIGLTSHQLSRAFAGTNALNAHRLADLPENFRAAWDAERAAARGARIYERDELQFIRGLAELPRPEMVRMTLPLLPNLQRKDGSG